MSRSTHYQAQFVYSYFPECSQCSELGPSLDMSLGSWRTGYGASSPSGGYAFSHETPTGVLVYSKSVEKNKQTVGVDFLKGLRLKFVFIELWEHYYGHGLGLIKIPRGDRILFVGVAPANHPPLQWY